MSIGEFSTFAPYLSNPLTLAGLGVFLLFSVHKTLIRSGIIPPVAKVHAPAIVKMVLSHGFWIAVILIIFGFGYNAIQNVIVEIHHSASILGTRSGRLEIVDAYLEMSDLRLMKPSTGLDRLEKDASGPIINVKLTNNGTGDAFIYSVRLSPLR